LTGLLAALSFGIIFSPVSKAATTDTASAEGITLSPVDKRYSVDAGLTKSDTITVLNDGQVAYDFLVYGAPFWVKDAQYTPDFASERANADAYKWVRFPQSKWHIEPRQTINVPFTVTVPKDGAPGGHYGAIFAEVQPADAGGGVARKKRVGSILYVNVNGKIQRAGETESISIDWLQNHSPVRANVRVNNTGNTDFPAKQSLTVANVFGHIVYQASQEVSILPDSPRSIILEWSKVPWLGFYKATVTSTVLDKTTTKGSYVLVAPVWFLVLVIFVCGAGVVYAIRGRKPRR